MGSYILNKVIHICIKLSFTILLLCFACIFIAICQIGLALHVVALALRCRFPVHLEGACKGMIDQGLLSCICTDAVCNIRSYIKVPASLFCPPCSFPFKESKYAPHLLLNKLNFLIPSVYTSLEFCPLAS